MQVIVNRVHCHDIALTIYSIIPYTTEVATPYTITGPAIMNILAAVPSMNPSVLNSSAGATTELAKPVIGTSVPAPPCLAILSYSFKPVSSALISTSVIETAALALSSVSPRYSYRLYSACPRQHISPPIKNALGNVR